jgi:hypothetical protein
MALFRDDPSKFMDEFSKEFETFFMDVMKRKGGLRVRANTVYQEVVADRQHIHMNCQATTLHSTPVGSTLQADAGACSAADLSHSCWLGTNQRVGHPTRH